MKSKAKINQIDQENIPKEQVEYKQTGKIIESDVIFNYIYLFI